jgi:acetyltransferase-like isoleucine patch superfamily enzyme
MKYKGENRKYDQSLLSAFRLVSLVLVPFIVYPISLLPTILTIGGYLYFTFNFFSYWFIPLIFLPFVLFISYFVLVISFMVFTALTIKVLHLSYKPGKFSKSIKDKNTFHYALYYVLYRPTAKLVTLIFIPPLYSLYLKMVGAKLGKQVFFGERTTISDPCVLEIGDRTLIGGGVTIMGHLGEDKFIIKKVKIENHCLIGAESLIMPGVIMKHHSVVGGKSLVTKNKILEEHTMYGGIPVQEIKKNK